MRMSSIQIFQQGISSILARQAEVSHTEQQLATGRRVLTPADDPVAAAQILDITEDLAQVDQFQRNGNLAQVSWRRKIPYWQTWAMCCSVRELVVQANNASQSPETRRSIATEVNARIDELLALANTRDASGEYIFAGFQAKSAPFARQGRQGLPITAMTASASCNSAPAQLPCVIPARTMFMSIPAGNGVFVIEPAAGNTGTAVVE